MSRRPVASDDAPAPAGPYAQAVEAGGLLFCSGQIALDPATGELAGETAGAQAARCLDNLEAVCAAAGTSLARAVKATVFVVGAENMPEVNDAYAERMGADPPARASAIVSGLPRGALVMIDATVAL